MLIQKAAKGNINTRHGEDAGRSFPHVGIDIGWGEGYELYAPAAGHLTWAWMGTYGNRCIITHSDGTWSLIAHAAEFFKQDAWVAKGEHIGTMGRTGGPWGTAGWYVHCHQEYHLKDGRAVDPIEYMADTAGGIVTNITSLTESEKNQMEFLYVTDSVDGNNIPGWALLNTQTGKFTYFRNDGSAAAQERANGWARVFGNARGCYRNDLVAAQLAITETLA